MKTTLHLLALLLAIAVMTTTFTTQLFAPPTGAQILSDPTDAIGLDNFNGLMPLMIQVELSQPAQPVVELGHLPTSRLA